MPRIGVLFIGANGGVATSVTAGVFANIRGLVPPYGMVTALPEFADLSLPKLDELVFGGWDLRTESHATWMKRHALVRDDVLEGVWKDATGVQIRPAPDVGISEVIRQLSGVASRRRATSKREAATQIMEDIRTFRDKNQLDRVVVVNVASSDCATPESESLQTTSGFRGALDEDDPAVGIGMVYAYAALESGCNYVNFTPTVTVEVPALVELSIKKGVVVAGKDGKTGQTLYKTVLAPMLYCRNLRLTGWHSTNLLGNDDGRVLQDPEHSRLKILTKSSVLDSILGYRDFDHRVRIEFYGPRGDAKEAWDCIDFKGWLGTPMTLRVNWNGVDSMLAAPLVVDLIRLVAFGQCHGDRGIASHLAAFFKSPLGTDEHDFFKQTQMLFSYFRQVGL